MAAYTPAPVLGAVAEVPILDLPNTAEISAFCGQYGSPNLTPVTPETDTRVIASTLHGTMDVPVTDGSFMMKAGGEDCSELRTTAEEQRVGGEIQRAKQPDECSRRVRQRQIIKTTNGVIFRQCTEIAYLKDGTRVVFSYSETEHPSSISIADQLLEN